jgi:hypothetical protein
VSASPPGAPGGTSARAATALVGFGALGAGESNLQLTEPLLWVMIGISVAGAIVTFSFLVYAVWRFRDPKMRRRKYG